jgi:hypothetical protein
MIFTTFRHATKPSTVSVIKGCKTERWTLPMHGRSLKFLVLLLSGKSNDMHFIVPAYMQL